ncbi:MAG: transfer agent family protein [Enterovirga sp.]|jgi:hypothetical protein|nr:transfer agent family protein [Enterovirga sp.]
MANRRRGEVAATIAGRSYTLCLTLGSLAELEDAFAVDDLAALAARFGSGRLGANDLIRLVAIGLRGGGCPVADAEVRAWPASCAAEIASAVSALLRATFEEADANPPPPQEA